MNSRKITVGEIYHAKRPRFLRPVTGPGIHYGPWQVKVLAKGQPCEDENGKALRTGVLVIDEAKDEKYTLSPKLILRTWAEREQIQADRAASDAADEAWETARESEIAESHLTMCAHLQRQGINLPDELLRPRSEYTLTAQQILLLTNASPEQIQASSVRPMWRPKDALIPAPIDEGKRFKQMLVLQAVADQLQSLEDLNRDDPIDLTQIMHSMGAPADAIDEPIIGHVLVTARTDSVASLCEHRHKMKMGQTRLAISELRKAGMIMQWQGGWRLTPSGKASLAEWAVVA